MLESLWIEGFWNLAKKEKKRKEKKINFRQPKGGESTIFITENNRALMVLNLLIKK